MSLITADPQTVTHKDYLAQYTLKKKIHLKSHTQAFVDKCHHIFVNICKRQIEGIKETQTETKQDIPGTKET